MTSLEVIKPKKLVGGKHWQFLAHYKIYIFLMPFFVIFQILAPNFSRIFKFSRPKRQKNLIFWAWNYFLWDKKWVFCPLCTRLKSWPIISLHIIHTTMLCYIYISQHHATSRSPLAAAWIIRWLKCNKMHLPVLLCLLLFSYLYHHSNSN